MTLSARPLYATLVVFIVGLILLPVGSVFAHCDTMDGPVVADAKQALEKGDVTPVLKWVDKDYEQEVRDAFKRAAAVRGKGPEVQALADTYFYETLVRVHRAGEGEPYTGLKPAGTEVEPAVQLADKALSSDSVDDLVKKITDAVAAGIKARFNETKEKKERADESVNAGREFVSSYVDYIHYVEKLDLDASGKNPHHEAPTAEH